MVTGKAMLEGVFGNVTIERILFTLIVYGEEYPLGMAKNFAEPVNRFQQQLRRLENAGIVVSRLIGKVRIIPLSLDNPFLNELKAPVQKAYEFLSVYIYCHLLSISDNIVI